MSSYDKNNAINADYESELNKLNKSAIQTRTHHQLDKFDDDGCEVRAVDHHYYDEDDDDDDGVGEEELEEDVDEYVNSGTTAGELVNLSRQSMVPLHELIAYYQYIQQGDNQHVNDENRSISGRSSGASQKTAKPGYSHGAKNNKLAASVGEPVAQISLNTGNHDDLDNASAIPEGSIVRAQIHNVKSDNQTTSSGTEPGPVRVDKQRIRANVVLELINSERDFVKHLRDVVEGYLYPARRHPEIFTAERINTIFANIEQLYEFQRKFLDSLEACINWTDLAKSEVGLCFLQYEKGFSVYHHYCNNHPNATSELQDLYTKPRFVKFFEACRLLQNMIDISLDGFLLTPIQKICKYPLQLTELLKNTDLEHPDYVHVSDALESMRNCANLANERKRRIEALADIMSFQEKLDNWFGQKLSETSSILIHSGEMSKMSVIRSDMSNNMQLSWSHNVQLYLFDHLLLYCKRDLLKRNNLILKGRINMDMITEISDADEYKPKRSFKVYLSYYDNNNGGGNNDCHDRRDCFVFVTRSEREKDEWIGAFERERNLIESDENEGFQITEREIGVARRALQNRKHSRSARYRHKRPDTAIVDQLDLDDANMIMNRTLSLPSCIHPSHVMNFVEDSRVVSTRKKNTSPSGTAGGASINSSRSPMSTSQHFAGPPMANNNISNVITVGHDANDISQTCTSSSSSSSAGNWFKKMGSRKLSKGQVYNINGGQSLGPSNHYNYQSSHSPTGGGGGGGVIATAATIVTEDSAAINYDQLEKRHREHMVGEEQARLFRLNNDLPPPPALSTFSRSSMGNNKSPMTFSGTSSQQRKSATNLHRTRHLSPSPSFSQQPVNELNIQSLSLNPIGGNNDDGPDAMPQTAGRAHQSNSYSPNDASTFEGTVLLSTGRVVRVREDAV